MPTAFWKGVISFGMVAIPVKMSVGTVSVTPAFHLLHKKCLTRPKQVLYCEKDKEYFTSRETVRGYPLSKEQYIVLEPGDFEKVPVKTAHTIDIIGFVEVSEIDPVYFYDSHYVEPEELGAKPFKLLKEALLKTGRAGIAKVAFQRREHLGCLRPMENILVLHSLHFQNEIVSPKKMTMPDAQVNHSEMEMAVSLINTMAKGFKPDEYRDEFQEALQKLVQAKAAGKKIAVPAAPKEEVGDLMEALRVSIERAKKKVPVHV